MNLPFYASYRFLLTCYKCCRLLFLGERWAQPRSRRYDFGHRHGQSWRVDVVEGEKGVPSGLLSSTLRSYNRRQGAEEHAFATSCCWVRQISMKSNLFFIKNLLTFCWRFILMSKFFKYILYYSTNNEHKNNKKNKFPSYTG